MLPRELMDARRRINALPCWSGDVVVDALDGGMTNHNYLVQDGAARYVARLGEDLPEHGILRWHELAAARAAHACGISPEVVFAEPGVMVSRYVEGRTLAPQDVRDPARLDALVELLQRCHRMLPRLLRGPVLMFWVFQVIRNYIAALAGWTPGGMLHAELPRFSAIANILEDAVGRVDIVFGHNDLLAGNFLDDGVRLWLIDWDYAGFNSPLFDLANLSVNNGFDMAQQRALLQCYFGCPASAGRWRAFMAMRCASLLRETLWGLVSHHTSRIEFDYEAYGLTWHAQFGDAWEAFQVCGDRPA